ncbi:MAG UNVERIFIED_CONTAM: hypothetical protein LVT10_07265 [Anaerolineae bacterium]|jgi:hypothetical protein
MEFSGLDLNTVIQTLTKILPILVGVLVGSLALQFVLYQFLHKVVKTKHALPYTLLAPAAIAIVAFLLYPLGYNTLLAFSELKRSTFPCYSPVAIGECELTHLYGLDYGFANFRDVFFRVRDGEILGWGGCFARRILPFPSCCNVPRFGQA